MPDKKFNILRTKLYRPPLTPDIVPRPHLLERLEGGRQHSLTLVAAPAGYGKTTLVSQWLETCSCPSAWLSLDAEDSDLRRFLHYGVAAVQGLFPDCARETLALLNELDLPAPDVIIPIVLNEVAQLHEPWILVLDDYHRLHDSVVHDLIQEGLAHPQISLHLVLISRHDPHLPLARLRAMNQLNEFRKSDLRFSMPEIQTFLSQTAGVPANDELAKTLNGKTEGWVTGLHLFTLSLHGERELAQVLDRLPEDSHYVTEYLFDEVFSRQSPAMQRCLLNTAILDRFCDQICDVLCRDSRPKAALTEDRSFPESLLRQGLFVVALDEQQHWFRYHHLFQQLLRRRLHTERRPEEIAALHQRASHWFESQGMLDEALEHALAADDLPEVLRLVSQHRQTLINREQWPRLASWLQRFPDEFVEQHPELLMLKAWLLHHRVRMSDMAAILDRVKTYRDTLSPDRSHTRRLRGEYAVLRSHQYYVATDISQMRDMAQLALQTLPPEALYARSLALMLLSASWQMDGQFRKATGILYQALANERIQRSTHHTRLLTMLGVLHWLEADLPELGLIAMQHIELSRELELAESATYSRYLLGLYSYERNELAQAEPYLASVVNPAYPLMNRNSAAGSFLLALTSLGLGKTAEAEDTADRLLAALLKQGHPLLLGFARSLKAELALRQGRLSEAVSWQQHQQLPPLFPLTRAYLPHLTAVKVFLAQTTTDSLHQAETLLTQLREYHERIHHTRFLIEILAVQSLLEEARGDRASALSTLGDVLRMAEPGGFLRLFVDLGPGMALLLHRYVTKQGNSDSSYPERVLAAFPPEAVEKYSSESHWLSQNSPDALTDRELDILLLLEQRFQNQEIADRLCISPETVKRHLSNLYQKLDVHRRREAVAKARKLGLLPES